MSTFFGAVERTARVEHRCAESGCRRTSRILPGTRYVVESGVWEGQAWSEKLCLRCRRAYVRALERFGPFDDDEGPALGGLLAYLREARHYGYETRRECAKREAEQEAKRLRFEADTRRRAIGRVRDAIQALKAEKVRAAVEALDHEYEPADEEPRCHLCADLGWSCAWCDGTPATCECVDVMEPEDGDGEELAADRWVRCECVGRAP